MKPREISTRVFTWCNKVATDQNLSIRLDAYSGRCKQKVTGDERRIQTSIRVEPSEIAPIRSAQHVERAADQDLIVRLDGKSVHNHVGTGIEVHVHAAVRMQPAEGLTCLPAQGAQVATDQYPSIALRDQCADKSSCAEIPTAYTRIKVGVETPVWLQLSKMIGGLSAQHVESSADDNSPVHLHRQGGDPSVGSRVERGIDGPVRIQTAEVASRLATHRIEAATHHDSSICLAGQTLHRAIVAEHRETVGAAAGFNPGHTLTGGGSRSAE